MLILGKARAKDSTKGYATTFLQHLDAALEHLVANGIRLVVNAGGPQPGRAGRGHPRAGRSAAVTTCGSRTSKATTSTAASTRCRRQAIPCRT